MKSPALLVLPGWDDHGKEQFDALSAQLAPGGWVCRRANLPDASWPAAQRKCVSRSDSLHAVLEDYMNLAAVRGVARSRMGLLGFSYGGYMAAFLAAEKPVDFLVLRSPALYLDEGWTTPKEQLDVLELEQYRSEVHTPEQNRALWCCSQFRGDVLLIDSQQDEVIPPPVIASFEKAFTRARSLSRHTLEGADHQLSLPQSRKQYHDAVVAWLNGRAAPN